MAQLCSGRTVIVTGAGGGLGREYALKLAEAGANIVVNDLGTSLDGSSRTSASATRVVAAIEAAGGRAVANNDDVSSWRGAQSLIAQAIDEFGGLDVLINNAGILRDRMIVSMTPDDWDDVIRVHLRGTAAPMHWAAKYWRERSKAGFVNDARIINTTSASGLYGNVGQSNYGAAKAGIAGLTLIASQELDRYGVTVNAVAPSALTRMTQSSKLGAASASSEHPERFGPEGVAPLVTWLSSAESHYVNGRVFNIGCDSLSVAQGWHVDTEESGEQVTDLDLIGDIVQCLVRESAGNANIHGVVESSSS